MQKPTYNDLNTWLEHAIQERDHLSVKVETLQDDLEKTRKALETLQEFITKLYLNGNITDEQLKRYKKMLITALEQKDK